MVGTRSRAIRCRLPDNDLRCSASDRRWFPARPAQHVHRRRNNGKGRIQNGKRRVETCNAGRAGAHRPSEALHPTRSSDLLPRLDAGARPYRATRCENASRCASPDHAGAAVPTIASRDPTRRRAGSHLGSAQSTQSSVPIQDLCVYPEPDQKSFRCA